MSAPVFGAGVVASSIDALGDPTFQARSIDPTVSLQLIIETFGSDGVTVREIRQYFAPEELKVGSTVQDVIEAGGIQFSQRLTSGHDASFVVSEVGDRATLVQVGPYPAALVWANPIAKGARRSFNLYWSDGQYDFTLRAGTSTPEEAVIAARSAYCG